MYASAETNLTRKPTYRKTTSKWPDDMTADPGSSKSAEVHRDDGSYGLRSVSSVLHRDRENFPGILAISPELIGLLTAELWLTVIRHRILVASNILPHLP